MLSIIYLGETTQRMHHHFQVVRYRRLALVGHTAIQDEPAGRLPTWVPEEPRRIGWPINTLKAIIQEDTGLEGNKLLKAMKDQESYRRNFVQHFTYRMTQGKARATISLIARNQNLPISLCV